MVFEDVKPKSSSSQALSIVSVSGLTTQGVLLSSLKTLEGCSSFMIQVLSCGHTAFCLYIATVDGFPPGSANIEKSWTCLQEGIKGSMDLKVELSKIGQDTILKEKTINYVSIIVLLDTCLLVSSVGLSSCISDSRRAGG